MRTLRSVMAAKINVEILFNSIAYIRPYWDSYRTSDIVLIKLAYEPMQMSDS